MPSLHIAGHRPGPLEMKHGPDSDVETQPEQIQPKRQATEGNRVASEPPVFPWTTCEGLDDDLRFKIKEKAVKIAEDQCTEIQETLESTIQQVQQESPAGSQVMPGLPLIKQWLNEHEALRQQYRSLEILVGVEGPTGAGKSSFLGSLLLIPELFPSGHQGAETASVTKVSWNWDDTPGHEFRAEVTFRPLSDIHDTFKSILTDIKTLHDRKPSSNTNDDDDDDGDDGEEEEREPKRIIEDRIKDNMTMVKDVWGFRRADLEAIVKREGAAPSYQPALVRRLLDKNPEAHHFLRKGSTDFKRSTLKDIEVAVYPFLTSKPPNSRSEVSFAVWHLVKDVHIFVKAPILKSGITLVDLPGCGDSMARRSEIAKKYSHLLDVRLVVSPVVRAADEKEGQVLMESGFDQARMMIQGKYDGHSFGVVLSKADEIPAKKYLTKFLKHHDDPETEEKLAKLEELEESQEDLQCKIKEYERTLKKEKDQEKKALKAYKKAKKGSNGGTPGDPETRRQKIKELQEQITQSSTTIEQEARNVEKSRAQAQKLGEKIFKIEDWLHRRAIAERNRVVQEKIQANYNARQNELNRTDNISHVLPMFAISTEAFWQLKETPNVSVKGYHTTESTGVPAVERWIRKSTLRKREKHIDDILCKYKSLMNLMSIFCQEKVQIADFGITLADVQDSLEGVHQKITESLNKCISTESTKIGSIDPLANRAMAVRTFRKRAGCVATDWSLLDPNDDVNMPWSTYGAIMRNMVLNNECTYTSKGMTSRTYHWVEDFSQPALVPFCKELKEELHERLIAIGNDIASSFKRGWEPYSKSLEQAIRDNYPILELSFSKVVRMMPDIELKFTVKIHKIIKDLSTNASHVPIDTRDFMMEKLIPIFKASLEITGPGCYKKRRSHNVSSIKKDTGTMCHEMIERIATKLEERQGKAQKQLARVPRQAVSEMKEKVDELIKDLLDNTPVDNALREKKLELQANIRAHLGEWEQHWLQQEDGDENSNSESPNVQDTDEENSDSSETDDDDEAQQILEGLFSNDEMD